MTRHTLITFIAILLSCTYAVKAETEDEGYHDEAEHGTVYEGGYGDPYGSEPPKPTEYTEHTLYADEDVVVRASIIKHDGGMIVHQEGENLTTLTIERDGKDPVTLPHDGIRLNVAPKIFKHEEGLFVITIHNIQTTIQEDGSVDWSFMEVNSLVHLIKWDEHEPALVFTDRHVAMQLPQPPVSYIRYEFVSSWGQPLQLLLLRYTNTVGLDYLTPYQVECLKTFAYLDSEWVEVKARDTPTLDSETGISADETKSE